MATGTKTISAFVIGAVLGAGITYFGLSYPPENALTGTVAPAERYQAAQPGADSIQLGDESLQQVMQTDVFNNLINDEAFIESMRSEDFQAGFDSAALRLVMSNASFNEALRSEKFLTSIESRVFRGAMNEEAYQRLILSPEFRNALADESMRATLNSRDFNFLMESAAVRKAFQNMDFLNELAAIFSNEKWSMEELRGNAEAFSAALNEAFYSDALEKALGTDAEAFYEELRKNNEAMLEAFGAERLLASLAARQFERLARSEAFGAAMESAAVRNLFSSAEAFGAFENAGFLKAMESSQFRSGFLSLAFLKAVNTDEFFGAARSANVLNAYASAEMANALESRAMRASIEQAVYEKWGLER